MSDIDEKLQILRSCRTDWVNALTADADCGPSVIQDLANIQLCIMAFEIVASEEAARIREEDARRLRDQAANAPPWPPVGSPAWFEQIDRNEAAA